MDDVSNPESVYKDSIRVWTHEHADAIFSETRTNKIYHYLSRIVSITLTLTE